MDRVANSRAREYVNKRLPFIGSNTYAQWVNGKYVVYSYGSHFPMYVWDKGWIFNIDRYSRTTSKHQSQLRPTLPAFGMVIKLTTKEIIDLI